MTTSGLSQSLAIECSRGFRHLDRRGHRDCRVVEQSSECNVERIFSASLKETSFFMVNPGPFRHAEVAQVSSLWG